MLFSLQGRRGKNAIAGDARPYARGSVGQERFGRRRCFSGKIDKFPLRAACLAGRVSRHVLYSHGDENHLGATQRD
jgi:hypothetical protein